MNRTPRIYHVVINDEGQYSAVASDFGFAPGWRACGITGTKSECLDHIERNWEELVPRSVRDQRRSDA